MATLQEYLEQDKEKLLADLQQAKSPEKTQEVLGRELDRMLIRYNEDCAVPEVRDAAAYMLQTARNAVPLVDTLGETKIWEEMGTALTESGSSGKDSGNTGSRKVRPDGDFRYGRHHLRDHCPGDEFQCSGG